MFIFMDLWGTFVVQTTIYVVPHLAFPWVLGIKTQVPTIECQDFYPLLHLPSTLDTYISGNASEEVCDVFMSKHPSSLKYCIQISSHAHTLSHWTCMHFLIY